MKRFLICLSLFIIGAPDSYASFMTLPPCDQMLKSRQRPLNFALDPEWKKILSTVSLSSIEEGQALAIGELYRAALAQRSAGLSLANLSSEFFLTQIDPLIETQKALAQIAGQHAEAFETQLEQSTAHLQKRIAELEIRFRGQARSQIVAEKQKEIRDLLQRTASDGESAAEIEEKFQFAIGALSRHPETEIFDLKLRLNTLKRRLDGIKMQLKNEMEFTAQALNQLGSLLQESKTNAHLTFETFFQQLFLTAFLADQIKNNFYFEIDTLDLPKEKNKSEFVTFFTKKDLRDLKADLSLWLTSSSQANLQSALLTGEFEKIEKRFRLKGILSLPMSQNLSPQLALGLGFLPLVPAALSLTKRVQLSDQFSPADLFLSDFLQSEPHFRGLNKLDPSSWVAALNQSWLNWLSLLGDKEDRFSANLESQLAAQTILYYARYMNYENLKLIWDQAPLLIDHFHGDLVFSGYENDESLNAFLEDFSEFAPDLPNRLAQPRGKKFKLNDSFWLAGADLLISRLIKAGHTSPNTHLRPLLERFPTSSASAKYFVLKSQFRTKESSDSKSSGGGSPTFPFRY